ncbi:hypothetical protein VTL71DRAFT_15674, partial [Oculimacula yallundae]
MQKSNSNNQPCQLTDSQPNVSDPNIKTTISICASPNWSTRSHRAKRFARHLPQRWTSQCCQSIIPPYQDTSEQTLSTIILNTVIPKFHIRTTDLRSE